MRLLTWDIELRHRVEDVGWSGARAGEAGVSVLALKDTETGRYHFYDDTCLDEALDHLNTADLLIGFNTQEFDSAVVEGITGRVLHAPQYDILSEIWGALHGRRKGYKLAEVAERTIGLSKSGGGKFATSLVADGHWAKLFDYCTNDVHVTASLFNHIVDNGWVLDPDGERLWLSAPETKEHA